MTADVTARLADGAAAVANTASHVAARRALGLGAPGVSAHAVRDCYTAEDGMRLADLDADGSALAGAADAGEEALCAARDALAALREAWQGPSADAAADTLQRQCEAAAAVVAGLHDSAAALRALRERLGHLVDAKVDAAVGLDASRAGRPDGEADIGAQWVTAMRSATEAVTAAYDEAIGRLRQRSLEGPLEGLLEGPLERSPESPRAGSRESLADPGPAAPVPAPAAAPPVQIPGLPPLGLPTGPGAGLTGLLSGVAGMVSALAEALPNTGALPDTGANARSGEDRPPDPPPEAAERNPPARDAQPVSENQPPDPARDPPRAQPEAPASEPPGAQASGNPASAPAAEPAPAAAPEAAAEEQTPCEIAADELAQVGE